MRFLWFQREIGRRGERYSLSSARRIVARFAAALLGLPALVVDLEGVAGAEESPCELVAVEAPLALARVLLAFFGGGSSKS